MGSGNTWTRKNEQALLQGVGIFGVAWFQAKTGDSFDWPNSAKGRSRGAIYEKARRMYGEGGLTRGSYTMREILEKTGYSLTHIKRAVQALAQKWKRTSRRGSFLVYEEQLEEIIQWLKTDYWCKKHRLYNCLWCGTEVREHFSNGLCKRCYDKYVKRVKRAGLPLRIPELLQLVRSHKRKGCKFLEDAEKQLNRGRALSQEILVQLIQEYQVAN